MLYHGTLALRGEVSRRTLEQIRQTYAVPLFVDINLRPPWWDRECVQQVMHNARWVKLNEHELAQIEPNQKGTESRIESLCRRHSAEQWIITRGDQGAMVASRNGERLVSAPQKTDNVVDTVGAGDAFSSVMLLGQALGWQVAVTLERAHSFASAVVGIRGATISDMEFYRPFIDAWGLAT
jgi:fructokinase